MPRANAPIYSLNGGEVGDEALGRLDLERLQFAGSLYANMMPRIIGSMTLRPGLEHTAGLDIGEAMMLEYSYSGTAVLVPVLSDGEMRVLEDGVLVSRPAVSTTITNGDFNSFTGWTNSSAPGATVGVTGGELNLVGTTQSRASATQTISVALADRGVEHGLRIKISRGPVTVRLGSTSGAADLIPQAILEDGDHSIAFTPTTANIYVELFVDGARSVYAASCMIDAAGPMVLETPWPADKLTTHIRYKQNKDVLYVASGLWQQRLIQRRGNRSWGIQRVKPEDGPFVAGREVISMKPSVYTGNGTMTASRTYFEAGMVGRLLRLVQSGQTVLENFAFGPAEGARIRISGVESARTFSYSLSGTFSASIQLQIATDDGSGNPGAWSSIFTFDAPASGTYNDPENNVVKYIRFVALSVTSGTAVTSISYGGGSQTGVARIVSVASGTSASMEVLSRFYSVSPTAEWDTSVWSDYDGWPWGVETFGGRLYWGQGDFVYGSVPDAFMSFDDEVEGDSAPISRSIGASTDRGILWLLGLQRLIAGTDNSEVSIKASSFDEPLSGSAWFPVESSTQGSINLRAVKCDNDGIFVQASGTAIFALTTAEGSLDYGAVDLTAMHERICDGSPVVSVAVQRRPDTVVWFVLENGEARALTYRPSEKVIAWSRVLTDGLFKQVIANRGWRQDNVFFTVERDGTQRLERLADLNDCQGGPVNCLADAFSRFTATAGQTTFAVPHLDGLDVTVWANGVALHDQDDLYTVADGQVVLPAQTAGVSVVIGLPYVGQWKSTKLAYAAAGGTALFQKKRVSQLGLYLINTMLDGLRVGDDFSRLRKFTVTKGDKPIPANYLWTEFDADMMPISSDWNSDSRVCLEQRSPYPFTAGSLVLDIKTNG